MEVLTVGQYLRPSERHLPVVRYWHPDEFARARARRLRARLRPRRRRPARALLLPRRPARAAAPPRASARRAAPAPSRACRSERPPPARPMFPLKDNIPLSRVPLITIALILVNVIAYLLEIRHGGSFFGGPTSGSRSTSARSPMSSPTGRATARSSARTAPGPSARSPARGNRRPRHRPAQAGHLGDRLHLDVPARQLPAHLRQHDVPGDLRPDVEDRIGRIRFVAFYLLGGLVALAAQVAVDPDSPSRRSAPPARSRPSSAATSCSTRVPGC